MLLPCAWLDVIRIVSALVWHASTANEGAASVLLVFGSRAAKRSVFYSSRRSNLEKRYERATGSCRKSLLRLLGEHCSDPEEKRQLLHLSSRGGREEYAKLAAAAPSLLDLLRRFPSCSLPLAPLLDALPPLAPRLYSVSSSPLEHPGSAHVAFSVVRIEPSQDNLVAERHGVATGTSHPSPRNQFHSCRGPSSWM